MARILDRLVRLQDVLLDLADARRQLEGVPDSMRELHERHQELKAQLDVLEAQEQQGELDRRAAESAAEEAGERLKHYQEQINKITTQREYGSLLKEIDTVKAIIAMHEDAGMASLQAIEEAQSNLETLRTGFQEVDSEYQAKLAEWEAERPELERRLGELEKESKGLQEEIPVSTRSRFQRLFERQGDALAGIVKANIGGRGASVWHCSVCNYRVRPQVVVEIVGTGSVHQCDSCQRFLFVVEGDG